MGSKYSNLGSIRFVRVLPLLIILGVWQILASLSPTIRFFYGQPTRVFIVFISDSIHGGLLYDALLTFSAALLGLVIGAFGGATIAVILSLSIKAAYVARPYVVFLGAIPVVAMSPIIILWVGAGYRASVAVASFSACLLVAAQVFDGLRVSLADWTTLAKSFNASRQLFYRHLVVPGAAAWLFSSWRAAIGLAMIGAFVGEFISADRGIGRYILRAGALYDASRVFAGIIVIGLAAIILTGGLEYLEKRVFPWRIALASRESQENKAK